MFREHECEKFDSYLLTWDQQYELKELIENKIAYKVLYPKLYDNPLYSQLVKAQKRLSALEEYLDVEYVEGGRYVKKTKKTKANENK